MELLALSAFKKYIYGEISLAEFKEQTEFLRELGEREEMSEDIKIKKRSKIRIVDSEYIYVDNGGYFFELLQYEQLPPFEEWLTSLEISEGFYGYSEGKLSLNDNINPDNLEKIGKFFIRAASKLREIGVCRSGE